MTQTDYNANDNSVNSQEHIKIQLDETPRTHYVQIPKIISKLGLSKAAKILYIHYREVGVCWQTQKTIAEETELSERTQDKANLELSQKFDLLGGKPLIILQKRVKKDGSKDTNLVRLPDIWLENDLYFKNNLQSAKSAGGGVPQNLREGTAKSADKEHPSQEYPSLEENVKNVRNVSSVPPGKGRFLGKEQGKGSPVINQNPEIPKELAEMEDQGVTLDDQVKIAQRFSHYCIMQSCLDAWKYLVKIGKAKNLSAMIMQSCKDYDLLEKYELPASYIWDLRKDRQNFMDKLKHISPGT